MIVTNLPLVGNFILTLIAPKELHGCTLEGFLTKVHVQCNLSKSPDYVLCCSELNDRKTWYVWKGRRQVRVFSSPSSIKDSTRNELTNAILDIKQLILGSWKQKWSIKSIDRTNLLIDWFIYHIGLLQCRTILQHIYVYTHTHGIGIYSSEYYKELNISHIKIYRIYIAKCPTLNFSVGLLIFLWDDFRYIQKHTLND